jgi:hypothetical protein
VLAEIVLKRIGRFGAVGDRHLMQRLGRFKSRNEISMAFDANA